MSKNNNNKTIQIGSLTVGANQPMLIIAGPCVIESFDQCLSIGQQVQAQCERLGFSFIFKASFDKANRSSITSQRGPGIDEGLAMIERVGETLGVPVTTDMHEAGQGEAIGQAVDIVQIPAFLCRQTDLLIAAAETGLPVNVKKGQFLSPQEMTNVITKLTQAGAEQLMLTDRGTFFGYHRLVNDFVGIGDMADYGWPICFDVTHSTQQPGGEGAMSGGRPERAPLLARAATAAGVDALFIETHPNPPEAWSDAAVVLPIETTLKMLEEVGRLRQALGNSDELL